MLTSHLYPTKDILWDAMVEEVLVPALSAPVPTEGLTTFAPEVLRSRLEAAITRPGLSAAILFDRSEGHEARLAAIGARLHAVQERNLQVLAALSAVGAIRVRDTEAVAAVLSVLLPTLSSAGPALLALFGLDLSDPDTRGRIAAAATDLFLRGMIDDDGGAADRELAPPPS